MPDLLALIISVYKPIFYCNNYSVSVSHSNKWDSTKPSCYMKVAGTVSLHPTLHPASTCDRRRSHVVTDRRVIGQGHMLKWLNWQCPYSPFGHVPMPPALCTCVTKFLTPSPYLCDISYNVPPRLLNFTTVCISRIISQLLARFKG